MKFSALVEFVTKQLRRKNIKVKPDAPFDFCFCFDSKYQPRGYATGISECVFKVNQKVRRFLIFLWFSVQFFSTQEFK